MTSIDYAAKEHRRIERMIPRFLSPMLDRNWEILSIGCGGGTDVIALRKLGYAAWGLDPGRLPERLSDDPYQGLIRRGSIEDRPFGDKKFDFAYALEVIEHVGCRNFGTIVAEDFITRRQQFIANSLSVLKPNGTLLITTSNKLCPIDPGHWHRYHWLGRLCSRCEKFGLSIAWSKKNFLVSVNDVRKFVDSVAGDRRFVVSALPASRYPSVSEGTNLKARIAKGMLAIADLPALRESALAPCIAISIKEIDGDAAARSKRGIETRQPSKFTATA
jgi:SAM-dependent methyltransferase